MTSKPQTLRRLLADHCVAMPGAFNAGVARLIERAEFEAVYVSGAGLSNATAGVPDVGLLTLTEISLLAGYIAAAVDVPVIVDADTGFGGAENAARTVRELEKSGLAGCHIEDQEFPKRCGHLAGKSLVAIDDMKQKIAAAAAAKTDPDFLLIARTDARAVEGFDAAVDRAKAYLAAGADAIFPEALQSADEFRQFAARLDAQPHAPNPRILLANMTEFGKGPLLSVSELADFGYRIVIFPQTAFRVMMKAAETCLADLKNAGTQKGFLDRMQTRQELYDLLQYDPNDPKA